MRIERLDILRYRALADVTLPFRSAAKLHLVYGPQEAGKTTALEAISDALFGFEQRLDGKDVRFSSDELRLGLRLSTAADGTLDFRRRKARADTLLTPDEGAHLPDHALAPYLRGVARDAFEARFALDTARMREGAADLEATGGDAGSALVAASSGHAGLLGLVAGLESEADGLFSARKARHRLFYQSHDEHEAAAKAEREAQLTQAEWGRLQSGIAAAREREAELETRRIELRHEIGRLETLIDAEPVHERIAAVARELEAFDDLSAVEEGTADRLERLVVEDVHANTKLSEALDALALVADQLAEAEVEENLVLHADAVQALAERVGAVEEARQDLPKRRPVLAERERRIAALSADLGVPTGDLASRRPTVAALARLKEAAREGRAIAAERERLKRAAVDAAADDEAALDPEPLAARFAAFASTLRRTENAATQLREADARAADAAHAAARLSPPVVDLQAAQNWRVPDAEAIEDAGAAISRAEAALAMAEREAARLSGEMAKLDRLIAADRAAQVVTRADIVRARRERDAALADAARLPALIREADALADRALADAETTALAERRIAERDELAGLLATASETVEVAKRDVESARDALRSLFRDVDVAEHDAASLARWASRVVALREDYRTALGDAASARQGLEEREALLPALRALGDALTLDTTALPLDAAAALVSSALTDAAKKWQARTAVRAISVTRAQEEKALAGRDAAWHAELAQIADTFGLADRANVTELEAVLEALERVPDALDARDDMQHRVEAMESGIARFDRDVAAAVAEVDPTLGDLPPALAVKRMSELCDEAKRMHERHRMLVLNEEAARERVAASRLAADAAKRGLDEASAAIAEQDALRFSEAIEQLRARDKLLAEHRNLGQRLQEAMRSFDQDEIETAFDGFDPVEAELALERLRADDERLRDEDRELHTELHNLQAERRRREEAGGAEEHAFAKEAAAARMAETGRRWLVLRAARALLHAGLERARAAEFGPWLERASTIFADLTDRSFERVERDYSTGGAPRMVGIRPNGERVATDGMSEGTLDQLYLALRLAHLAERGEAAGIVPFIGDDIFMTFDRARTRNGLQALAAVSGAVQPILFTHHDFVVEEAQAALGNDLDLIELSRSAA